MFQEAAQVYAARFALRYHRQPTGKLTWLFTGDGGVPACKKCVTRGLTCPGYDKMPLKWLTPGQTRSKGKTATYEKAVVSMPSWTDVPRQLVPKDAVAIVDGIQYCESALPYIAYRII